MDEDAAIVAGLKLPGRIAVRKRIAERRRRGLATRSTMERTLPPCSTLMSGGKDSKYATIALNQGGGPYLCST